MITLYKLTDTLSKKPLFCYCIVILSVAVIISTSCIVVHKNYKISKIFDHVIKQPGSKYVYYISFIGIWLQAIWLLINNVDTKSLIGFLINNSVIISCIIVGTYDDIQKLNASDLELTALGFLNELSVFLFLFSIYYIAKRGMTGIVYIVIEDIFIGPATITFGVLFVNFLILMIVVMLGKRVTK